MKVFDDIMNGYDIKSKPIKTNNQNATEKVTPNDLSYIKSSVGGGNIRTELPTTENAKPKTEQVNAVPEGDNIQLVNKLYKPKELSEEEQAKEDKQRRLSDMFNSLGDGISHLSNIYFASKGAEPVAQNSLFKEGRERYQQMLDKRKADMEKYKDMYMSAYGEDKRIQRQNEQDRKTQEAQKERQRLDEYNLREKLGLEQKSLSLREKELNQRDELTKKQVEETARKNKVAEELANKKISLANAKKIDTNKSIENLDKKYKSKKDAYNKAKKDYESRFLAIMKDNNYNEKATKEILAKSGIKEPVWDSKEDDNYKNELLTLKGEKPKKNDVENNDDWFEQI